MDIKEKFVGSLEEVKVVLKAGSYLQCWLNKAMLYEALLIQINSDVQKKIEQDVELFSLQVTDINTLKVEGRAGAMGIKKEFEVICELVLNKEDQLIHLKVQDISVKGGFLIRKGFEMVEPKIRTMVESAVKINLNTLLEKATFKGSIPKTNQSIEAEVSSFVIEQFRLIEKGDLLDFRLEIESAGVDLVTP